MMEKFIEKQLLQNQKKTRYEVMNGVKLEKNLNVIELDDGTLQIQNSKNLNAMKKIMK